MPRPPERNLLEATLQNIEVAVDAATANDVIASIPVIGTAFKICKAIDDIRARAFAAKLNGFVAEPGLSTPAAKAALAQKLRDSPDEARKVGETLFLVLDRFIDLYKPAILAKVFVAYLDNVVTARDLQRLAQSIDIAFAEDLKALIDAEGSCILGNTAEDAYAPWRKMLLPSGLTINNARCFTVVRTSYDVTPLGQLLWKAFHLVENT